MEIGKFAAAALLSALSIRAASGLIVIDEVWPDPADGSLEAMPVGDTLPIGLSARDDEDAGAALAYAWGFSHDPGDGVLFRYVLDGLEDCAGFEFEPADTNVFCGAGTYEIRCEVGNGNGNSATQTWTIAVVEETPPGAPVSVSTVEDLRDALRTVAQGGATGEVVVLPGTYVIGDTLRIYPNTTLTLADGATIRYEGEPAKVMLLGSHFDESGWPCTGTGCAHGGYSQCHDVVVRGGCWDRNSSAVELSQAFKFHHADRIAIRDLTVKNCSNHHFNLSGSRNVVVENVRFAGQVRYTGTDVGFWGERPYGDESRYYPIEAVHLDYLDSVGEASAVPLDRTPCRDILVTNCVFDSVFAGAGVHHLPQGERAGPIRVVDCRFSKLLSYAVYFYGVDDGLIEGNAVTGGSGLVFGNDSSFRAEGNAVSGAKEYVVFANNGSAAAVSGNTFDDTGSRAVHVSDGATLTATGNAIRNTGDNAILLKNCGKSVVDRNTVSGAAKAGILAMEGTVLHARDNVIESPGTHGIGTSGGAVLNASGNTIRAAGKNGFVANGGTATLSGNEIVSPKLHGIYAEGSARLTASGNTIRSAAKSGFAIAGSTATLSGNKIYSAGLHGVSGDGSAKISASSNTIESPASCGFSCQGKARLETGGGNVVKNPGKQGVFLSSAGASSIVGVKVAGSASDGIRVVSTDGCTVSGNSVSGVKGKKAGIVMEQCRSGTVTGNTVSGVTGHGIRIFGTKAVPCTVTVTKNKATGAAAPSLDIILGDWCRKCKVLDNVLGRGRFAVSSVGTSGNTYRPAGTSLTKLSAKGKTAAVAKWTALTGVGGFEIQYSASKKFAKAKTVSVAAGKTTHTVKKLAAKKKYWFRIRSYHAVGKTKYYSSWSAAKTVKL